MAFVHFLKRLGQADYIQYAFNFISERMVRGMVNGPLSRHMLWLCGFMKGE